MRLPATWCAAVLTTVALPAAAHGGGGADLAVEVTLPLPCLAGPSGLHEHVGPVNATVAACPGGAGEEDDWDDDGGGGGGHDLWIL